jgi:hypothetical protein
VSDHPEHEANRFFWRFGETEVTVTWEPPSWVVKLHATSRLAGPNALVSRREYQLATHAAYAVMTHVSRVTYSDDEGVEQRRRAARWMRDLTAGTPTGEQEIPSESESSEE